MTEHLFKLKRAGKTVGYLELRIKTPHGYPVLWFRNLGRLDEGREWHSGNNIQADSIHLFVTKDKNGKDVFAGDEVDSMSNRCLVMWHKVMFQWCLWHIEGDYYFGSLGSEQVIELIEDKTND
jgi:hypothetical protein